LEDVGHWLSIKGINGRWFSGIEKYRSVISVGPGSAAKTFAGDFPGTQVERLWASYRGLPSPLVVRPGAAVIGPRSVPLTASAAAKETKGRDFSRPQAGIAGSLLQAKLEARNTRVEIRGRPGQVQRYCRRSTGS